MSSGAACGAERHQGSHPQYLEGRGLRAQASGKGRRRGAPRPHLPRSPRRAPSLMPAMHHDGSFGQPVVPDV